MRPFFLFISLFFLSISAGYIIRTLVTFFLPPNPTSFYIELIYRYSVELQQWAKIHGFFNYLGIAFLSASVEHTIYKKKTRYILSISLFISIVVILLILPYEIAIGYQIFPVMLGVITVGLLILTYFYLGIKNPGFIRKKSIYIAFGLILFILGMTLNNYGFMQDSPEEFLFLRYTILAPIPLILGSIFLYNGYRERE